MIPSKMGAPSMTIYYHCAPIRLGAGSIIEAGNWGRLIKTIYKAGENDGTSKIIFELAFEAMRVSINPNLPSRLSCLFCCPTLEDAQSFRSSHAPLTIIHRVRKTDPEAAVHHTNWSLWGLGTGANYEASESRIRSYWTDAPTQNIEVLVDCSVEVIEALA
jgi:hypothetical protein